MKVSNIIFAGNHETGDFSVVGSWCHNDIESIVDNNN